MDPETALAAIPGHDRLAPAARDLYAQERRSIHARHRAWRATMPSIDALFDDDAHRAKALAGNLSTELEAALAAWLRVDAGRSPCGATREWLRQQALVWRRTVQPIADQAGWEPSAMTVFDTVLEELVERALERCDVVLSAARCGAPGSLPAARARRLASWLAGCARRLFRPDQGPG